MTFCRPVSGVRGDALSTTESITRTTTRTIEKRVKLLRTRGTDGGKDPENGDRRFHTDGFGLKLAL
jgi:hypothetical protein